MGSVRVLGSGLGQPRGSRRGLGQTLSQDVVDYINLLQNQVDHIQGLIDTHGSKAWWEFSNAQDAIDAANDAIEKAKASNSIPFPDLPDAIGEMIGKIEQVASLASGPVSADRYHGGDLPSGVVSYIDRINGQIRTIRSLREKHSGKWWWDQFGSDASDAENILLSAGADTWEFLEVTQPDLPDAVAEMINEIQNAAAQGGLTTLPQDVIDYINRLQRLKERLNTLESSHSGKEWWSPFGSEVTDAKGFIDETVEEARLSESIPEPELLDYINSLISEIETILSLESGGIPLSSWRGQELPQDVLDYVRRLNDILAELRRLSSEHGGSVWWEAFANDVPEAEDAVIQSGKEALSTNEVPSTDLVQAVDSLISEIKSTASQYEQEGTVDKSVLPQDVQNYIATLNDLFSRLRKLETTHQGKGWWVQFSDSVASHKSKIQSAIDEAKSTASITRPGLPDRTRTLIANVESAESSSSDTQTDSGTSTDTSTDTSGDTTDSGGGDTSPGEDSTSSGGDSTQDPSSGGGNGTDTTTEPDSSEQTESTTEPAQAGFGDSTTLLIGGGIFAAGLYLYTRE